MRIRNKIVMLIAVISLLLVPITCPTKAAMADSTNDNQTIDLDKCLGDSEGLLRMFLIMFVCGPAAVVVEEYTKTNNKDPQEVFDDIKNYEEDILKDEDGDGDPDLLDVITDPRDKDGITDDIDNCPDAYNPDQKDTDKDGVGDACDPCPNIYSLDNSCPVPNLSPAGKGGGGCSLIPDAALSGKFQYLSLLIGLAMMSIRRRR